MNPTNHRVAEAATLTRIGAALFPQNLRIDVVVPADLAEAARHAWARDDDDPADAASRDITQAAGQLALIGPAIEERGTVMADGTVRVALDAWQIGSALDAADSAGLLPGE